MCVREGAYVRERVGMCARGWICVRECGYV